MRTLLFTLGLATFLGAQPALAQTTPDTPTPPQIFFSCIPQKVSLENRSFSLNRGEALTFSCIATNNGTEPVSGLLMVKQQGGSDLSAASTELTLTQEESKRVTLTLPTVFQEGTYQYHIMFLGNPSSQPLAPDMMFTGTLSEKQAQLHTATLDQERYQWDSPFTLNLAVTVPEENPLENYPLFFRVTMLNQSEEPCSILVNQQPLLKNEENYPLHFPAASMNCANALEISLLTTENKVLDRKVLAVSLPEIADTKKSQGQPSSPVLSVLTVLGGLLALLLLSLLGGYFFFRRRR